MQVETPTVLKELMRERGLGQADLAKAIGVSQATICRALSRKYKRKSRARTLVENYLEKTESELNKKQLPEQVTKALAEVWDGTEIHAHALARIIRSLEGLGPK